MEGTHLNGRKQIPKDGIKLRDSGEMYEARRAIISKPWSEEQLLLLL